MASHLSAHLHRVVRLGVLTRLTLLPSLNWGGRSRVQFLLASLLCSTNNATVSACSVGVGCQSSRSPTVTPFVTPSHINEKSANLSEAKPQTFSQLLARFHLRPRHMFRITAIYSVNPTTWSPPSPSDSEPSNSTSGQRAL